MEMCAAHWFKLLCRISLPWLMLNFVLFLRTEFPRLGKFQVMRGLFSGHGERLYRLDRKKFP